MLFGVTAAETPSCAYSGAAPAIYRYISAAESRPPLPFFGGVGTGGIESIEFALNRQGYHLHTIIKADTDAPNKPNTSFALLMETVQAGFGRTFSHLPAVFGVSRQTLYNWRKGEQPKDQHHEKLVQLAEAARVFTKSGLKPTAAMLDRTVAEGKSFIELLGSGADGREVAQKLIHITQRGSLERNKLGNLLGDRKLSRLEISAFGRQSFPDEA